MQTDRNWAGNGLSADGKPTPESCLSANAPVADVGQGQYLEPMKSTHALAVILAWMSVSACTQSIECNDLSPTESVALATEQKMTMLNHSTEAYRDNFNSDTAQLADDPTGYVAKIYFKGDNGRTLVALIDHDCNVGWSER